MSAAIALVLLAETTTTCAPGGASRLGGHAILVRPVGTFDPVPFEPLFEVAAGQGYDWRSCNALNVPTQRTRPDGTPAAPLGKIDWFLCRGLRASDAATVAAVDAQGVAISDHEVLGVTIAP